MWGLLLLCSYNPQSYVDAGNSLAIPRPLPSLFTFPLSAKTTLHLLSPKSAYPSFYVFFFFPADDLTWCFTDRHSLTFLPLSPHLLLSLCLSSRSPLLLHECHAPALCKGHGVPNLTTACFLRPCSCYHHSPLGSSVSPLRLHFPVCI